MSRNPWWLGDPSWLQTHPTDVSTDVFHQRTHPQPTTIYVPKVWWLKMVKTHPYHPISSKKKHGLVGGQATPLKNMNVNWDDEIPNIYGKIKNGNQTTNQWWFSTQIQFVLSSRGFLAPAKKGRPEVSSVSSTSPPHQVVNDGRGINPQKSTRMERNGSKLRPTGLEACTMLKTKKHMPFLLAETTTEKSPSGWGTEHCSSIEQSQVAGAQGEHRVIFEAPSQASSNYQ